MSLKQELSARNDGKCELCNGTEALTIHEVSGAKYNDADGSILICAKLLVAITSKKRENFFIEQFNIKFKLE